MDDLSNETNDKLNERVAREVMGWHLDMAERYWLWRTGRIAAELSWSPTTNAEHAAQLMRHLCESGRFDNIVHERTCGARNFVGLFAYECRESVGVGITYFADDPNGFVACVYAALRAYKALAEEK